MKIGLLIYGSLETVSGGYLYDRRLVEYLRAQGDEVQVLSLPWRNYARHLADNLSAGWLRQLRSLRIDILLQDELNHPSLFWMNRRLPAPDYFERAELPTHWFPSSTTCAAPSSARPGRTTYMAGSSGATYAVWMALCSTARPPARR
jgi:hypothetical protein